MRSMPDTDRVYGWSKGAEMATNWPAQGKAQHYQRNRSAEEGNRTLLRFLKTIGRSAVRTRGSGQEAPRDAVAGQRYWPGIGPAPPSATRETAILGVERAVLAEAQIVAPRINGVEGALAPRAN